MLGITLRFVVGAGLTVAWVAWGVHGLLPNPRPAHHVVDAAPADPTSDADTRPHGYFGRTGHAW